jgi:hypothetical protein
MGMEAFAERAHRELAATVETVRKRTCRDPPRADRSGATDRAVGRTWAHQPRDRSATLFTEPVEKTTPAAASRNSMVPQVRPSQTFLIARWQTRGRASSSCPLLPSGDGKSRYRRSIRPEHQAPAGWLPCISCRTGRRASGRGPFPPLGSGNRAQRHFGCASAPLRRAPVSENVGM